MTKKTVKAMVCWVPGGRSAPPPAGMRYSTIVFFDDEPKDGSTWSADFITTAVDDSHCSVVDFSYLVEEAPFENLTSGRTFKLYEGHRLAAEGRVL